MKERDELFRALNALYLEVDKQIADDIMLIVVNYTKAVEKMLPPCEGEPCTCNPRVEIIEPNK